MSTDENMEKFMENINTKEFNEAISEELKQENIKYQKPKMENTLTPLDRARQELFDKRKKFAQKKAADLGKHYTDRFNDYLREYFNNFTESEEENEIAYNVLNTSWKEYCVNANRIQKYVTIKPSTFEEEVARIIKENPQFQKKDQIVDLTNLTEE